MSYGGFLIYRPIRHPLLSATIKYVDNADDNNFIIIFRNRRCSVKTGWFRVCHRGGRVKRMVRFQPSSYFIRPSAVCHNNTIICPWNYPWLEIMVWSRAPIVIMYRWNIVWMWHNILRMMIVCASYRKLWFWISVLFFLFFVQVRPACALGCDDGWTRTSCAWLAVAGCAMLAARNVLLLLVAGSFIASSILALPQDKGRYTLLLW